MSLSTINVSLVNTASAKAQLVSLPRSMTIAELQMLSGKKSATFVVAGCTPAPATTLGDLYDACATAGQQQLEVRFTPQMRFGAGVSCCTPCCSAGYDPKLQDEINKEVGRLQDQINAQGGTDAIVEDMLAQQQQQQQ